LKPLCTNEHELPLGFTSILPPVCRELLRNKKMSYNLGFMDNCYVHVGPIAPVVLNVATSDKVLSTYNKAASRAEK
jgi:hypothetical protein